MEETNNNNISRNILINIKSKYILKEIFDNIKQIQSFKIVKYNKPLQKKLDMGTDDYKNFKKIEIELIPIKMHNFNYFINIKNEYDPYYHIYFNGNKNEILKNYFTKDDDINKIKIILDEEISSFENLFKFCDNIEKIRFIKFNRKDITNMSNMFFKCSSLKEIKFNNFYTNNVYDMSNMFYECTSLKELNLSNFNTNNVTTMNGMFYGCSSLKELNISTFNTSNVRDMNFMFSGCSSLRELNLNHFYINNVFYMDYMFSGCSLLSELKIDSFNMNNKINVTHMFYGCTFDLKKKIILQDKKINKKAFS